MNRRGMGVVLAGEERARLERRMRIGLYLPLVVLPLALFGFLGYAQPLFSREQAIQRASTYARQSWPEMGMQEAKIDDVTAELSGQVWTVTVRGTFRYQGMSVPGGEPPVYESTQRVFRLDATTGELKGFSDSGSRLIRPAVVPTPAPRPPAAPTP